MNYFTFYRNYNIISSIRNENLTIKQLGLRVIRTTVISSLITIITNSITLSNTIKDFRIITPLVFSIWTSVFIFLLGLYGGYTHSIPALIILVIFTPMVS
ncbi:unnamed protein product, partial [marine sediment metagenome]